VSRVDAYYGCCGKLLIYRRLEVRGTEPGQREGARGRAHEAGAYDIQGEAETTNNDDKFRIIYLCKSTSWLVGRHEVVE